MWSLDEVISFCSQEKCLVKNLKMLSELKQQLQGADSNSIRTYFQDNHKLELFTRCLMDNGVPKDFQFEEEREYVRKDFIGIPETASVGMECMMTILEKIDRESIDIKSEELKNVFVLLIILVAGHHKRFPWADETSIRRSSELLFEICKLYSCENVQELIQDKSSSKPLFAKPLFKYLKPKLTRGTWKKNLVYRHVYHWVLKNITVTYLVGYLNDVLPPALLFVDDYMSHNQILGVDCLHYIVNNTSDFDSKSNGYIDVIFDALQRLTYVKKVEMILVLHPCIRTVLFTKLNRQSEQEKIYCRLLDDMYMEQHLKLRRAFIAQLPEYIDSMGIAVVKFIQKTLKVILEYIETQSEQLHKTQMFALKALKILIKVAWPRIPSHYNDIFQSLFKLSYDMNSEENFGEKDELEKEFVSCLICLKAACPEQFANMQEDLKDLDSKIPGVDIFLKQHEDVKLS